jgi:NitT/TauT family transport system ATP-binding protein
LSGSSAAGAFGRFKEVHRAFARAHGDPLVAVERISFDVREGTLVTLLGPSGCGKTTLLRIAAGLIRATRGMVEINGIEVTEPQPDFGIAFQQSNLMPWRTVVGNVLFPMEISRENGRAARERAMELLAVVGLGGFERAYPAELSGGMQQRVALCRALIHRPNSISEAIYLSDAVVVFSKRPAVVADHIDVGLPYPRTPEMRYSPEFTRLEHRAGRALGIAR